MSNVTRVTENDKSQDGDDPTDLSSSSQSQLDNEIKQNQKVKKRHKNSNTIKSNSKTESNSYVSIESDSEDDNLKKKRKLKYKNRSSGKEIETITLISEESDNGTDRHTQQINQIDLDTTDVSNGSSSDDEGQLRKAMAMSLQPFSDDDEDIQHKTQPMASKLGNLKKGEKLKSPIRMMKSKNYEKLDPTCNEDAIL
ncbi:unnamed protein product [[Candida] boidinii]|nr:unnamed protein product [[Candida] boidinii]